LIADGAAAAHVTYQAFPRLTSGLPSSIRFGGSGTSELPGRPAL
jgi:hypothetical protein